MRPGPRPFVGRRDELALLRARMSAAAEGNGSVLVLTGPAGIGKTRLVEEALQPRPTSSSGAAFRVGRGYCLADRSVLPLWPWQQAFRAVVRRAGANAGAGAVLTAFARSVGEGVSTEPGSVAAARLAGLATVAEAVLEAAAERALTIVLEDIQWADANTVQTLQLVAASITDSCLLVIATARDADPTDRVKWELGRIPSVHVVPLRPLTVSDIGRYVAEATGAAVSGPVRDDVVRHSGGLPLLLDASIAAVGGDPPDLVDIASALLDTLTPPARRIVEVTALLRQPVAAHVVAAVAAMPLNAALDALRTSCRAGLLVPAASYDGAAPPAFRFAHDLLADGVVGGLDDATRLRVHRAAALALERGSVTSPGYDAAEIAAHWRKAGGDPTTQRRAAVWAQQAAQAALRSMAYDEVRRHRSAAVESLRQGSADDAELAAAIVELARAHYLCGQITDALELCEDAAAHAAAAGRHDLLAAAALVVRWVTFPRAAQIVTRLCRAALDVDQPRDVAAKLLSQQATIALDAGNLDSARTQALTAKSLALESGDPQAMVDAARAYELTLLAPDDVEERLQLADLALKHAERLGHPISAVVALEWRMRAAYQLARVDVVQQSLQAIEDHAKHGGLALARWHAQRCLASRAAMEGRFDTARTCNTQATQLARATGDTTAIGLSDIFACHLALLRGDPSELSENFWPTVAATEHIPLLLAMRARVLLLFGRAQEAGADHDRLHRALVEPVVDHRFPGLLIYCAELLEPLGNPAEAKLLAGHLRPYTPYRGAQGMPTAMFLGCAQRAYGLALRAAGNLAQSELALREALDNDTTLGARPYAVLDAVALGRLLLERGNPTAAMPIVQKAVADARLLDLPGPLANADQLLIRITAKISERDPLTRREREVALLVRAAMSNRRIAEQLVLSERTVETHVRSILGKLGHANRTEFVAHWHP